MKVTIVQPQYKHLDNPDGRTRAYILTQLKKVTQGELILFPEYSNAGGLSAPDDERRAMQTAPVLLDAAAQTAREKGAVVAINVLMEREGKIKNSTYLFGKNGETVFIYNKQHLPASEVALGMEAGNGEAPCTCVCDYDGVRYAFLTCYDVYFNEQIEYIAAQKPDVILVPGLQRGERRDILLAQTKMIAFRCNAFVLKSSFSMQDEEHGGCAMIVAPSGEIIVEMGAQIGSVSVDIAPHEKYMRAAGYGGRTVRNDAFIDAGLCPNAFAKV